MDVLGILKLFVYNWNHLCNVFNKKSDQPFKKNTY